ncbi:MAG TPA: hypothetical protein VGU61_05495 [Noviherbaspirillum sp.]|jgi:hypothetical protein|uniref:hypothetical protein n=1 Tax=Noviherbaspirillum sp. TaxID=1926288 RepID=UPI002DDCA075|nr:hypothetical protein [Noviherbaspirillum sp.]HEV2609701.1 hypothetical protein [Noviherbaspirillum sp.]
MSANNDRIRRELGVDLARAGYNAGVNVPMERRPVTPGALDHGDEALLYFTSFEQFEAWCRMTGGK